MRLTTTWGSALYLDAAGTLRHGDPGQVPANLAFHADPAGDGWAGRLICQTAEGPRIVVRSPDGGFALTPDWPGLGQARIVPLERGLIALQQDGHYLRARPDGGADWGAERASWWEFFLLSARPAAEPAPPPLDPSIDRRFLQSLTIDPRVRAKSGLDDTGGLRVLIYGYPFWSHGRVYYDLCRHLHPRGFTLDILNWREGHAAYFGELAAFYDIFLTSLDGVAPLVDAYGVPPERIAAISHHEMDIRVLLDAKGPDIFNRFAAYGVVSECLYERSVMMGVPRLPTVTALGVEVASFDMPIAERCETVGYASSMSLKFGEIEVKRGHLAEQATQAAGLAFRVAGSTGNQTSFHDMPGFYRSVDAVLVSSLNESVGLPFLEAAAAGRLVIGPPVGDFARRAAEGGGLLAPLEPERYCAFVTETLTRFRADPAAYRDACRAIRAAAQRYDWCYRVGDWADFLTRAAQAAGAPPRLPPGRATPPAPPPARLAPTLGPLHVINLDQDSARLARFTQANAHLAERLHRVPAIPGAEVDRIALITEGLALPDLPYGNGSLGCALSHIALWRRAANTGETLTICEDDVVFSADFLAEAERLLAHAPPGWEMIHWGYTGSPLFRWLDFGFARAKLEYYAERPLPEALAALAASGPRSLLRAAHSFGLQAYTLTPAGARRLLAATLPLRRRVIPLPGTEVVLDDTGVDCPIQAVYAEMGCYIASPPLALHADAGHSTRSEADAT